MNKYGLSFLVAVALATSTAAAAVDDPYVAGNAAAARGDHAAAVTAFERAVAEQGWSAHALLGLGNAYAATGDHGRAILAFERARILAPGDDAIARNLAAAREAAGLAKHTPARLDRALAVMPTDRWAWLALGGLAVAAAAVVMLAWSRRRRTASVFALVSGGAIALGGAWAAQHTAPALSAAIVLEPTDARIAPLAASEVAFTAPAGARVDVEQRRTDYVYVRWQDERAGWVPDASVAPVVVR